MTNEKFQMANGKSSFLLIRLALNRASFHPAIPPPQNKGLAACWQLPRPANQAFRMLPAPPGFAPPVAPATTQESANGLSRAAGWRRAAWSNETPDNVQLPPPDPEFHCSQGRPS